MQQGADVLISILMGSGIGLDLGPPNVSVVELLWGEGRKLWLTGEGVLSAGGLVNTHATQVGVGKAESD